MSGAIRSYEVVPLEKILLRGDLADILDTYRAGVAEGTIRKNAIRRNDYRRWALVLDRLDPGESLLDIGLSLGQFANAVKRSGKFERVIGADKVFYPGRQNLDGYEEAEIDLIQPANPLHAADTVTCLEVLEHLTNTGLTRALEHLRALARRSLIITVPFEENPLPSYHRQYFSITRLEEVFPGGKITLISERAAIHWAMVEMDMTGR